MSVQNETSTYSDARKTLEFELSDKDVTALVSAATALVTGAPPANRAACTELFYDVCLLCFKRGQLSGMKQTLDKVQVEVDRMTVRETNSST